MATTRDRRLKTDSPTPVPAIETGTLTPTTKTATTAIKLKRMSRSRSGVLSAKSENEDGNDSVGLSEDTQSSTASADVTKTPNTRTKRLLAKDEKGEEVNGDPKEIEEQAKEINKDPATPRTRKLTKAQMLRKKGADLALRRRQGMIKRNSLPLPIKSSSRAVGRRSSTGSKSDGKADVKANETEPDVKPEAKSAEATKETEKIVLKKNKPGRPAKIVVDKPESGVIGTEDTESIAQELELTGASDVTFEKIDEAAAESDATLDISIKQEKNTSALDLLNVRRSTRQRKSTIKDRDSPFTGKKSQQREKSESKRDSISPALSNASIKAEKDNSKAISITVETDASQKDPSLSPELVSEEMDTESVQHLYDKPDFLENNLGIEQDPKLGEIVKVQEKTKTSEPPVIKSDEEPIAADDIEMKQVEDDKSDEKTNGDGESDQLAEEMQDIKKEPLDGEPQTEKSEAKNEDSGEENKENNVESSAKSTGSGSPRSEDSLKAVSEENVPKPDSVDIELLKEKESHLLSLGLLTHKAADEAKLAKLKRKEEMAKTLAAQQSGPRKSKKDASGEQYTGTLKTIIKLNRTEKEKRKTRMPLKMTFQKKNRDRDSNGSSNSSDSFYTIQEKDANAVNENFGAISRKSHNRSYNHDQVAPSNDQNKNSEPVVNKELEQSLVIPEKASSFKVHPERLCKDQCFYCGGKFGLYDTPCHIAQIKSTERQKKILESEEKLTKDSCLCDACFRHVDRRANCPSYKSNKRLSAPQSQNSSNAQQNYERTYGTCNVIDCDQNAVHSIRKKWFIKMKKTIAKIFHVDMDAQPTNANVSICEEHFSALSHIMVCAMCKRKLPRNHIFYISQDIPRLEQLISEQGMLIRLANSTLVVCKLCSYFNNLLFKPPEPKTQKADFVKNYTKKLLKQNNLEAEYERRQVIAVDDDDVQEVPMRNDNLTLTIRNGKIQPKKPNDRLSKEVTITATKGSPSAGGHIMLDNDVMVGYDVPFPLDGCPSPPAHSIRNPNYKGPSQGQQKLNKSYSDREQLRKRKEINDNNEMARALKSNPNISMRELFPGEEEMGLNVNLPFNTSLAQRTADGWFKSQMTVQYDEVTKALWENLQRPYGNQSSFVRHLILLEKYYRNGDLVLSPSASNSAISYSESVRNRLRSYDNIPSNSPVHNTNFSNEISIIPTQKPRGKQNDTLTITPQPGGSLLKRKASQSDSNSAKHKVKRSEDGTPKKTSPPELISFAHKPVQKSSKDSPPEFLSQSVSITPTTNSTTTSNSTATSNNNVIVLPETLTPQEKRVCMKSWRPTLIPISGSSTMLNAGGPLYQTVDGRKLPALVQVMSGGKPYHISINDYNRMCIIRREKLQQQSLHRSQNAKPNQSPSSESPNGNAATSNAFTTSNSLSIIPMPKEKDAFKTPAASTSPRNNSSNNKMVIPNQILEQNSLIPIESNGKKHHNGSSIPPLTAVKGLHSSMGFASAMIPSALADLSKTVNNLQQPAAQLAAWKALWNENSDTMNSDNMAALAQIANLANLGHLAGGGMMMDSTLLSKIPKSLTVIPQAKSDRRSSDEQNKHNSAST